ncbi:hypothetical protein T4B_13367 [Trichinella pseudospiralis]|uniref:Uncharacterized protein n=1 Tax=Trichinella pseudospiralis TaxID=6337 RepID=A0A0V1IM93_TRIPS|nr:hypothetical protein T4B_13367 [Trichinella pseudospiralis]
MADKADVAKMCMTMDISTLKKQKTVVKTTECEGTCVTVLCHVSWWASSSSLIVEHLIFEKTLVENSHPIND